MTKGRLYLIPAPIADGTANHVIPLSVTSVLPSLTHFLAEEVRTARRYLSALRVFPSIEALHFQQLNKDTQEHELPDLMKPLFEGHSMGILSESGCPGIADPGALAVAYAHRHQIEVVPLVGPSSIVLALMASGLNGQAFSFQGYLPIDSKEAAERIKELERESRNRNQTQIFIETPYRNNALFEHLVKTLQPSTRLTIAMDLTGDQQRITTQTVQQWRKEVANWPKIPTVFLFLA